MECGAKVTENDDQNIRQGEGDEIVVHGAVQTLALDDHHDDGQIAQQTRDEDDQVKYCHRPQKSLVITSYDGTNGIPGDPTYIIYLYLPWLDTINYRIIATNYKEKDFNKIVRKIQRLVLFLNE